MQIVYSVPVENNDTHGTMVNFLMQKQGFTHLTDKTNEIIEE